MDNPVYTKDELYYVAEDVSVDRSVVDDVEEEFGKLTYAEGLCPREALEKALEGSGVALKDVDRTILNRRGLGGEYWIE